MHIELHYSRTPGQAKVLIDGVDISNHVSAARPVIAELVPHIHDDGSVCNPHARVTLTLMPHRLDVTSDDSAEVIAAIRPEVAQQISDHHHRVVQDGPPDGLVLETASYLAGLSDAARIARGEPVWSSDTTEEG